MLCKDFVTIALPMKQRAFSNPLVTTLSSKGQVTIPVKIRKHLGIAPKDKVVFAIESGGNVKVTQAKYPDIKSIKGAAGSLNKHLSWKETKQIAYDDRLRDKNER